MPWSLTTCPGCSEKYSLIRKPHSLPCGHCACLTCLNNRTMTPTTSMSVCPSCHGPFTKRDIRTIDALFHEPSNSNKSTPNQPSKVREKPKDAVPRKPAPIMPDPTSSERLGKLEAQVIRLQKELTAQAKATLSAKEQFNKSSQAMLELLKDNRELRTDALDWWKKFEATDKECTALRDALTNNLYGTRPYRAPVLVGTKHTKGRSVTITQPYRP